MLKWERCWNFLTVWFSCSLIELPSSAKLQFCSTSRDNHYYFMSVWMSRSINLRQVSKFPLTYTSLYSHSNVATNSMLETFPTLPSLYTPRLYCEHLLYSTRAWKPFDNIADLKSQILNYLLNHPKMKDNLKMWTDFFVSARKKKKNHVLISICYWSSRYPITSIQ